MTVFRSDQTAEGVLIGMCLTSAVWAHSPVLGGAVWMSVWHHHCPPTGCAGVQRGPQPPESTPWVEEGAGKVWTKTKMYQKGKENHLDDFLRSEKDNTSLCTALQQKDPDWDSPWTPSEGWIGSSKGSGERLGPRTQRPDWPNECCWWIRWSCWSCAVAVCDASLWRPDHLQEDRNCHFV